MIFVDKNVGKGRPDPRRLRRAPEAARDNILRAAEAMLITSGPQALKLAASFPLGRIGRPDDVAMAALFLSSESSAWLTGITLDVAGGRIMLNGGSVSATPMSLAA